MSTKRSRQKRQPVIEFTVEEDDEAEDLAVIAKVKAPIIWAHAPTGFVIFDLQESHFEEVITLVKEDFMRNEILCRNTNILEDQESIDDFINQTYFHMNDKCSIISVNEESQEIAGVVILRILYESDYGKVFSRVKLISGEAYKKISNIKAHLNRKTDIFKKYNCDKFLRIYLACVSSKYRQKGVGYALLHASLDVARSLKIPVVMGIFSSYSMQLKAKKLGFELLYEVYYVDWVENTEMIFSDPGAGNYSIALMAIRIPLDD